MEYGLCSDPLLRMFLVANQLAVGVPKESN
jgi:hypothetical protein